MEILYDDIGTRVLDGSCRLADFRREATGLFRVMQRNIRREAVGLFFRVIVGRSDDN
jgi:preprotein translocase subunit SecA